LSRNTARNQGNTNCTSSFTTPAEGESEVKMIFGEEYKYCGKCHRWNKGQRAHTTREHVVGLGRDPDADKGARDIVGLKNNDDKSTTSDGGSEKSSKPDDGKTRHPNTQSYHFKRVAFIEGI
jgi:hypothetical protein